MKREKDIQDPIMHTHTGQRRIPERLAIINHIAQFWNPDRHPEMYYTEPKPRKRKGLLKIVRQIQMAPSIRNVKSLTRNAYESRQTIADWNQQVIQQTAKKGKRHYEKEEKPGEKEKMGGRESVKISPPAPLLAAVYYKTVQ